MSLERFLVSQQEWSQATFGTKEVRGPLGPLDHLKKEVEEAIIAAKTVTAFEKFRNPDPDIRLNAALKNLLYELVDCFFLNIDAVWRAGFNFDDFEHALWKKLEKNKNRKWPPLNEQDPTKAAEHDRS